VSHAQILVGDGDVIRRFANVLAKGINCLNTTHRENPCGECLSCRVFDTNNHPDTFYVTNSNKSSIGVDDVRAQIIEPMSTKPFSYKYKVFIIDKADTLTPAAQSALLKTIEEPAPYGFFLFLAPHEHNFLPTVLSRCYLRKIGSEANQNQGQEHRAFAKELADTLGSLDVLDAVRQYRKLEPIKETKEDLLSFLDVLYQAYGEKISAHSPAKLLNDISAITHTKNVLSQNANTQLALELLLIKLSSGKG